MDTNRRLSVIEKSEVKHLCWSIICSPFSLRHVATSCVGGRRRPPLARRSMGRTRPPQLRIDRLKVDSVTRRVYGEIVLGSSVGRARLRC